MHIYRTRPVFSLDPVKTDSGYLLTPNWNIFNAAKMIWIINLYFVILAVTEIIVVQTARSNGLMSPDLNGPNWGPGSECRRRLRRLQGGQGIEAVTPPDLHGEWVSSSCETRPGPSYLTRRYKFHSDHSFTFYQFYYSDHQCQSPAYSFRIRGQLTVGGLTFTLDGANEAMYELEKVTLTVFQDRFAMMLARQLNGSCPGMVEPNQPLAIFRKYVVLDNSRDVIQIDCTPGLGFTMNELQMIRQEVYQRRVENTGIVRRSESLYLGDIHTDFGQRVIYRSKGYQTPLRRYDDDSEDIGQYLSLKVGSYFSVRGGTMDKMLNKISIGSNSMFFPVTKAFQVEKDVVHQFFNPPVVRLSDIKDSPKKRRISFEGRVGQIGELNCYNNKKIRNLQVMDDEGNSVRVSLWGKASEIPVTKSGMHVFKNVEVNNNQMYGANVNSTTSMTIECLDEDETITGNVICVSSSKLVRPYQVVLEVGTNHREIEVSIVETSEIETGLDVMELPCDVTVDVQIRDQEKRVRKLYKK